MIYMDGIFLVTRMVKTYRYANMEEVRIMRRLGHRFSNIDSVGEVAPADRPDYELYLKAKASYEKKKEKYENISSNIANLELNLAYADKILKDYHWKRQCNL